ncbi:MAG: hypothetical protein J6Q22_05400, partial [Prevotella sp.]|nr:hypothetical protein [Prevotella sp.]
EGKMTFSASKSSPCRYSALSLQSETDGKRFLSCSFSQGAFVMPSSCLRSGFAPGGGEMMKAEGRHKAHTPHH